MGNGSASELINEIAGTSVSQVESTGGWLVDAGGTRFADGPRFVPYEDHTMALLGETLPEDARAIYYGDVEAPVVVIPFGEGEIVYLGFDWFDARPRGEQDGGWLEVLNRAIPGPRRSISIADAGGAEGDAGASAFRFTVSISSPSVWSPVTFRLRTAPGTADSSDIFALSNTVVTIPAGQRSTTVVTPVIGDTTVEPNETFTATVFDPMTGLGISRATATGTIVNDDAPGAPTHPAPVAPDSFTAKATVKHDRKAPYRFTVRGKVGRPAGIAAGDGCKGFVAVRLHRGKATQTRVRPVTANCTYRASIRVGRKGRYRVTAVFLGNQALKRVSAKAGTVRAG